jgi:hypothetical protein
MNIKLYARTRNPTFDPVDDISEDILRDHKFPHDILNESALVVYVGSKNRDAEVIDAARKLWRECARGRRKAE